MSEPSQMDRPQRSGGAGADDCCTWVPLRRSGGGMASAGDSVSVAARAGHAEGSCLHCGGKVQNAGDEFCGAGCAYAYRVVQERNWQQFYHIRDRVIAPVGETAFAADSFAWVEAECARAEQAATAEGAELTLALQGASCAACVWLIAKVYADHCSSGRIDVNLHAARVHLHWAVGALDAAGFARAMQGFGYNIGPLGEEARVEASRSQSRSMLRRIGLCTAFQMNVMLYTLPVYFGMDETFRYAYLFSTMSMLFATLSMWFGGSYFIRRAWEAIRRGGVSIDLPLALGIVGSYAGSMVGWALREEQYIYFDFVSTFILLMLVGRWAKEVTLERNRKRLSGLQPVPEVLRLVGDSGQEQACGVAGGDFVSKQGSVASAAGFAASTGLGNGSGLAEGIRIGREQLVRGMRFIVSSGQRVPVESVLLGGEAEFDLAWVNGEPQPRLFHAGERVPAAARYLGMDEVALQGTESWSDSLMAKLLQQSDRAEHRNPLIETVVRAYLIGIIGLAALAGLLWLFADGWWKAGAVVTAILVVSCPCALGLAMPLADELAIVSLRRLGVFVRSGDLWDRLSHIRRIVFDKTGTLTLEAPQLANPQAVDALDKQGRAALHALVRDNPHPVARALYRELLIRGAPEPLGGQLQEEVGSGVTLGEWTLGRSGWRSGSVSAGGAAVCGIVAGGAVAAGAATGGATVLARGGEVIASFYFTESVRADAAREIEALHKKGYRCEILSGDTQEKVDAMASALGIAPAVARGGLSPQAKAELVDAGGQGAHTLMIGDGANDSLAFDHALCRGTPVVYRGILEQKSDFYYIGQGIAGIRAMFDIDIARRHTHRALLVFMVAYNLLAVGAAILGWMNPLIAAILMPISSLATLAIVGVGMRRQLLT